MVLEVIDDFYMVIMLSNGGFYLGKLLSNVDRREEVVKILKVLMKRHMNVLDRQLSRSECSEQVIAMFFEKSNKNRQFVIDLFSNSIGIREQMETEGFIDQLLSSAIPEKNKMLAAFSQTAWGRAKLRTSGALDVVVDVFSSSTEIEEKLSFIAAFRHFVHDTAGMRHLSENLVFVNTVVRDINKYVEEYRNECVPSVDMEFVTKLRAVDSETLENEQAMALVEETVDRLHKDFYSMWSYDTPQTSPRRAHSMSPPYSPSPNYSFPSSVASSAGSSPAARRTSEGILDELSDVESDHEEEKKEEKETIEEKRKRQEKSIVEGELWLLTWLAQDDHNLQFLIRDDVVDCVVSYLRSTRDPDFRTYRVLRRMATHRTHVYRLLDLEFHVRILTGLCAAPCRMLKYAVPCKHCDKCAEHGREILREFASHVDNSYGDAHINSQFTKDDFVHRTKAAIAKIVLVKERIRLAKVPALTELFDALSHVMSSPENFKEIGKMTTYENGPSFVSQIIGALSILISGQKIKELCLNDMWYFPPKPGTGQCLLEAPPPGEELLRFIDDADSEIAVAPMKTVCENSHYFEGMYSSDFVEKTEAVRTFQVQSESCSPEDFRIFIHLLSTCTATCSTVSSAEQCATLLALSDQFLCPDVSERLCNIYGPLRTYLNGPSLHTLLPVALATSGHPTLLDTVLLTLVRFSSSENVTAALEAICENSTVVNTFITSLRAFLTRSANIDM
uniref:RYDR_ITPR domain-containing protein n=2 Tax=Caenorhabditis tropicalis TaxID=1561998 RepID=A0A1I7UKI9_9PELO